MGLIMIEKLLSYYLQFLGDFSSLQFLRRLSSLGNPL